MKNGLAGTLEVLTEAGLSESLVIFIENATIILITIGVAILADYVVKRIIINDTHQVAKKSKNKWT